MNDKPISVGDLVTIVRPARCCPSFLGAIFRVSAIRTMTPGARWACLECGKSGDVTDGKSYEVADGHSIGVALNRLKRIPPLEELEDDKRDEEITA